MIMGYNYISNRIIFKTGGGHSNHRRQSVCYITSVDCYLRIIYDEDCDWSPLGPLLLLAIIPGTRYCYHLEDDPII